MNIERTPLSVIDAHTHIGVDLKCYFQDWAPYALGWAELVEMGSGLGLGEFVVFPMPTHLGLNLAALRDGEVTEEGGLERVPYAFENRRMMQEITRVPESAERALPLWMFDPMREPRLQCEALRALSEEYRCSGLKVQATIIRSPITQLLGEGGCLLDLAEEKNWPVLIHTSVHPEDPWSQVSDILKIAESRPNIRFNLAHSCRFDRAALDRIAELPNAWFDCSAHVIHCQIAVEDHPSVASPSKRFVSDYRDPAHVLADLVAAYPDKLMWGSDAPFYSYCERTLQLVSSYHREVAVLRALDEKTVQRIGIQNTRAFLG